MPPDQIETSLSSVAELPFRDSASITA
jgi:hypothetical protein